MTHAIRRWINSAFGSRPKIVVYGLYKTGTTAIFSQIKNSLPYKPRCLFEPSRYSKAITDKRRGVLAKTIVGDSSVDYNTLEDFEKRVLIVRDPRDWIISGLLFLTQELKTVYHNSQNLNEVLTLLEAKEEYPNEVHTTSILELIFSFSGKDAMKEISRILQLFTDFELRINHYYLIKYEDLIDGKTKGLSDYLEIDVLKNAKADKKHAHVFRSGKYGNWKNWYTTKDVDILRTSLNPFLIRYEYDSSWKTEGVKIIDPEHCSRYVKRIVDRKLGIQSK